MVSLLLPGCNQDRVLDVVLERLAGTTSDSITSNEPETLPTRAGCHDQI